jgi:hypothetical protein
MIELSVTRCSCIEITCKLLVGKREGKSLHETLLCKLEDNIKKNLTECQDMVWIHAA